MPLLEHVKEENNQFPKAQEYKDRQSQSFQNTFLLFALSDFIAIGKEKECFANNEMKALLVTHTKLLMWVRQMTSLVQMQKIRMCL